MLSFEALRATREMALVAALRAALALLVLISRQLVLSEGEREAILGRVAISLRRPRYR
jgi:hypothetical protein